MLRALQTLFVHERNEQQAMQRAAMAQAQGLDPEKFATVFPGSTITTTTNNTDSGSGYIKGALLAAALATAGGGATWGLTKGLGAAPAVTPPEIVAVTPQTPAPAAAKAGQEYLIQVRQDGGEWRTIGEVPGR